MDKTYIFNEIEIINQIMSLVCYRTKVINILVTILLSNL